MSQSSRKRFLSSRSIRWKIVSNSLVITVIGIAVLIGVEFMTLKLSQQAKASYSSTKTAQVAGELSALTSSLDGTLRVAEIHLSKGEMLPKDDLEIETDEVKSAALGLIGELKAISGFEDIAKETETAFTSFQGSANAIFEAIKSGKMTKTSTLITEAKETLKRLGKTTKTVDEALKKASETSFAETQAAMNGTIQVGLVSCGILMLFTLLMSILMTNGIMKSISTILTTIKQATATVTVQTTGLVTQSTSLSAGAAEGAAAVQETVSTLEEISAMVTRTLDRVDLSTEATTRSYEAVEEGREKVRDATQAAGLMEGSIEAFSAEVTLQNEKMEEIVKVIREIAAKTKIINDIVFQTKLLSFNASIEAARAGEQGRGFTVVAEEIGNLAKMSGTAATEISAMVDSGVETTTSLIASSKKKVQELADEAKQRTKVTVQGMQSSENALETIAESVQKLKVLNQEILQASKEQSEGISNISIAMNELDQTISANATGANVTAETANQFSQLSVDLSRSVDQVQQVIFGSSGAKTNMVLVSSPSSGSTSATNLHATPVTDAKKLKLDSTPRSSKVVELVKGSTDKDLGVPDANDDRFKEVG